MPAPTGPVHSAGSPRPTVGLVEGDVSGTRLRLEVAPLSRTGATTTLTARLTVLKVKPDSSGFTVGEDFSERRATTHRYTLSDVRLFLPRGGQLASPAQLPTGGPATTNVIGAPELHQGESAGLRIVFAALPPDATSADVLWPLLGVVPGLPVTLDPPPALQRFGSAEPRDINASGAMGTVQPLTPRTSELAGAVRTSKERSRTSVVLAADVLFALDSATLSPAAQAALHSAAAQVQATGEGPIRITGHTDDQGTNAYNDGLSTRRAQAVAAALAPSLPLGQYPAQVAGRGKREPVLAGTSAAARAANRRVEIVAERPEKQDPAPQSPTAPTQDRQPSAVGREGLLLRQSDGSQVRLRADRTVREGDWLRVDMTTAFEKTGSADVIGFTTDLRDEARQGVVSDASGVAVLDGSRQLLPGLDPAGVCACPNWLFGVSASPADEQHFSLWVQVPARLEHTTTVQLPRGQGRLLDVPVEQG